jgi:hypothetical protein
MAAVTRPARSAHRTEAVHKRPSQQLCYSRGVSILAAQSASAGREA